MRFLAVAALLLLGACAKPREKSPVIAIGPGAYTDAFAAAKQVLIDYRFELDRVDARAGVITTRPKPTSGLATPWDQEQSSLGQELEDLLNRQYRRVRMTFEPAGGAADNPAEQLPPLPADDRRLQDGPLECTITVSLERLGRPGWKIETTSIRFSSFYYDPEWGAQGIWPQYTVPFAQDHRLAARLAEKVRARLSRPADPPPSPGK